LIIAERSAIFRTRRISTIYKIQIEGGGTGIPGQQLLTATEKNMEIWVGTKRIVFVESTMTFTLFSKSTKYVFNMQGARHSPNMLPTMPQYQAFHMIRWKKYIKEAIP
jgi:hypothetical protein